MSEKKEKPIYKNNIRINDTRGVNRLIQRVINKLIQGEISIEKAKAIGYLSRISLEVFELELKEELANIENEDEKLTEDWTKAVIEIAERRKAE